VVPQPGPPAKRPSKEVAAMRAAAAAAEAAAAAIQVSQAAPPRTMSHINGQGRPKIASMTRTGTGRKGVLTWMDAPDDVYFRSTLSSK